MWVCVYIHLPNSSMQAACIPMSIFKLSLTNLNYEFNFSKTGCHTKVKEPSLPDY